MDTLCHLLVTSSPVSYLFSRFEKVAGGLAFDVLKVDGWRLLTLHSTLKIEEDIWGDGGGGGEETELTNSLPVFSWMRAKLEPSAGPVNDAVLPSGRLLKATCHISFSIRGLGWEEAHLSPACQHRHWQVPCGAECHRQYPSPSNWPPRWVSHSPVAKYSIYNTLSYCESTATRRPQLSVLDSFRSVPQFWQQFLHCAGVTVEVPVGMQACAFFVWALEESIHVSVCFRKEPEVRPDQLLPPRGKSHQV